MKTADLIFRAIAHPTRRDILSLLADSQRSVKQLTAEFDMSQSAVSQHLRELREAKLVTSERVGLEQQYRLTGAPIKAVYEWSSQYRGFFDPSGHAWAFVSSKKSARQTGKKVGLRNGR